MFKDYLKKFYHFIFPIKIIKKIDFFRAFFNSQIFIVNKNSYNEDGLATNHITDFMKNEKFIKNYFKATEGTHKAVFRAYILNYFANYATRLFNNNHGCFIELGTHKGLMSKMILLNNTFDKKTNFYLFDTFTGIPLDNIRNDEIQHIKNLNKKLYNEDVYKIVKSKFSDFPFVNLVKGRLPETLKNENISLENIKFLHIDLNNVHAEIESIKFLYDKILRGAPIILDDYCYAETYRPQKDSWDKFAKKKGFEILSLPTGQGLFLKI